MGKKDKPQVKVTEYRMSLHYGIAHGPLDYIRQIIIREKEAWAGEQRTYAALAINEPELFGGVKKEGGAVGTAYYLPGGPTQTIPEALAAKVDLTTATMPAYRGIASLWFTETPGAERNGFYWTANSPFIPPTWVKVARASPGLSDGIARIWRGSSTLVPSEVDLGGGRLGNRCFKWDTNGDFAAWSNGSGAPLIWDLPDGGSPPGGGRSADTASGDCIHITDTGKLVSFGTGGAKIYNAATGALQQTVDLLFTPLLNVIAVDDITVGDYNYIIGVGLAGNPGNRYFVLRGSNTGSGYALLWSNVLTNYGEDVSAGPDFGYFVKGGIFDNATQIVRVDLLTYGESLVTPTGLTDFIAACHYDKTSGTVIIACINGDLFKYSANLATLLASHTGNGFTLGRDGLHGKRMSIAPGLAAFPKIVPSVADDIHIFSTADLALVRIVDGSDEGFSNNSTSFWGFNPTHGMAFLPSHNFTSYLWFIQAAGPDFDSNPAHIIYECLTNTDWGMGSASSAIDVDGFEAVAAALYAEDFGLSLQWTKQLTIEAFVSEILDHIEATLFINPRTGLLTLKLIRDDYSISGLPEFTPDNSVVTKFGRKLWGETINEIIVTFTNPNNEEAETVVAQDIANIAAQGGIVSDSRNYYGVRVKRLAARLAQRDLRTAASPLASCDIEVNREGWDLLPGDVLVLNSPEDGINSMVMRIGNVDYGKPGDPTVRAALMEDIFSLAAAEYTEPPDTIGDDDGEEPAPAANSYVFTLPYYMTVHEIDAATLASVEYPEVFAGVLASQAGSDTDEFELYGDVVDAGGGTTVGPLGTKTISVRATLPGTIAAEVQTDILSFPDRSVGSGPAVGGLMLIGEGNEDTIELCLILSFGVNGYAMRRGVLDTTPKAWALGTPVWFLRDSQIFADNEIRSEAEIVDYQILTRTSLGLLDLADAPVVSETLTARPWLPLRPANVKVNGTGFGTVDVIGVNPIPVTWANRNRLTEDSQILAWNAANVAGEAGQTVNVYATKLDGTVLASNTGLSGTSYNLNPADFGSNNQGYIVVKSQRDGLESLQGHRIHVLVAAGALLLESGDYLLLESGDQLILE